MKIKLQGVKGRGDLDNERVVLKVLADADIGRYLLGVGGYTDEKAVSTKLSRTFWFPDKQVKQGDFVVLFTKTGTSGQYNNKSDSVTHAFYIGLNTLLWASPDSAAILFEIGDWQTKRAAEEG